MPSLPDKGDGGLLPGKGNIISELLLFLDQANWIIGDVVRPAGARRLPVTDGTGMLLPGREVLVFGDAGMGDGEVAVIHHGAALIITLIGEPLEIKRTVAKPAEC